MGTVTTAAQREDCTRRFRCMTALTAAADAATSGVPSRQELAPNPSIASLPTDSGPPLHRRASITPFSQHYCMILDDPETWH